MDTVGRDRWCAASSDDTGNTRVTRELICAEVKTMFNLPDPNHHLSNTIKDIVKLTYFRPVCLTALILSPIADFHVCL